MMSEMLVILVVALLVFGPKELPRVAEQLGRAFGKLQKMQESLTRELDEQSSQKKLSENIAKAEDADDIYFRRDRQPPA